MQEPMTASRYPMYADTPPVRRPDDPVYRFRPSPSRYRTGSRSNVLLPRDLDMWGLSDVDPGLSITHFGPSTRRDLDSVLVPIAGGPNSDAAVSVAADLARYWHASLLLLTVVPPSRDRSTWMEADARLHNYADDVDTVPVEVGVRTRDDIVTAITECARDHDLVVIGKSERSFFRRLFRGTIPEQLAERTDTPLFVVEYETHG